MEKIYRLKYEVDEKINGLGHCFGKYRREFPLNDKGEVVKVLANTCVRCGAPVRIVDKPFGDGKNRKEVSGASLELYCKHGGPPINHDPFKNYFANDDAEEYKKKNEKKLAKLKRKHNFE